MSKEFHEARDALKEVKYLFINKDLGRAYRKIFNKCITRSQAKTSKLALRDPTSKETDACYNSRIECTRKAAQAILTTSSILKGIMQGQLTTNAIKPDDQGVDSYLKRMFGRTCVGIVSSEKAEYGTALKRALSTMVCLSKADRAQLFVTQHRFSVDPLEKFTLVPLE